MNETLYDKLIAALSLIADAEGLYEGGTHCVIHLSKDQCRELGKALVEDHDYAWRYRDLQR